MRRIAFLAALLAAAAATGAPDESFITVASTTSTENSGLLDAILPAFREQSGIEVKVIAVGTGQAMRLARRGDVDVLLVHDREAEERFVAEGWGVARHLVMVNDFLIVGPASDPAGIRGLENAAAALRRVAGAGAPFASRGDDSGTHRAERRVWEAAGIDPVAASGSWYRELGSGQGATLNTAAGLEAYTLTDRGTWLSFQRRGPLVALVEGDPALLNPYGAILVNPERHPHVKAVQGQAFIDWLLSPAGQEAIGAFRVRGEILFRPAAEPR